MFALAQWIRTTPLVDLSQWIAGQPLCLLIQENFWAIPTFQTLHILAIAGAFGSVLMINLRIFGLAGSSRTMAQTSQRYLPWVWGGLVLLVITGILMIIGEPERELLNPAFWIKMVLVIVVILVSLWFQGSVRRNVAKWETTHARRVAVRVGAAAVILLWCAVMVFGRWIAYAPT